MQEKYSFVQTHIVKKKTQWLFGNRGSHNTILLQLFDFSIALVYYGLYGCLQLFYLRRYLHFVFIQCEFAD